MANIQPNKTPQNAEQRNNGTASRNPHPYAMLPAVTVCAIVLSAVMAFGNPGLWMTNDQANVVDSAAQQANSDEDRSANINPGEVIGEYRSVSESDDVARANNIALASEAVNGTVIKPGETFSFNDVVGNTGTDSRYLEAPVIAGSQVDYERGGGICQVSTAIYIAALESDMEIVERHPHTLVTDYAPIGLDATIDYGSLDLQLKNTSNYPITIESTAVGQAVTVKLLGKPLDVGVSIGATSRIASQTSQNNGEEEVYVVESYRVYYQDGVKSKSEYLYKDTYIASPSTEVRLSNGGTDPTK